MTYLSPLRGERSSDPRLIGGNEGEGASPQF